MTANKDDRAELKRCVTAMEMEVEVARFEDGAAGIVVTLECAMCVMEHPSWIRMGLTSVFSPLSCDSVRRAAGRYPVLIKFLEVCSLYGADFCNSWAPNFAPCLVNVSGRDLSNVVLP